MIKLYDDANIKAIADAIRAKSGTSGAYKTGEMADAVVNIETYAETVIGLVENRSGYPLNIPEGVTAIANNRFSGDTNIGSIILPKSLTSVGTSCFSSCTALTSAEIKGGATIEANAFYGCSGLTSLSIDACTSAGTYAFRDCVNLKVFNAPAMTTLAGGAFWNCSSLETVNIPNIVSIGVRAFKGCTSLRSIYIPISCTEIDAPSIGNCLFEDNKVINIYCGAASKPDGWWDYWNKRNDDNTTYPTTWGVTPEQYEEIIQGGDAG